MSRYASPIAWPPAAQAEAMPTLGPRQSKMREMSVGPTSTLCRTIENASYPFCRSRVASHCPSPFHARKIRARSPSDAVSPW